MTLTSPDTPYPITYFVNYDHFSAKYRKCIATITIGNEPKSFRKSMKHERWRKSMSEEIDT